MSVRIGDLPDYERPRERLLKNGPEVLSDRELLALVIRNGKRGASAIDLASELLQTFNSLDALSRAHVDEIARVSGIGKAKASAVIASFHLANRARRNEDPQTITQPIDIARIAITLLSRLRRERTLALICDAANNLRHVAVISDGALDHSILPIRETLHAVLRHDGRGFAIAHNHPSGNTTPSASDISVTQKLIDASETVGLRFLDHVVVAGEKWERVISGFQR